MMKKTRSDIMSRIGIVTDSHSGIKPTEAQELGILILPMPFYFGNDCFYENLDITRENFFKRLARGEKVSTSQPSPEQVMRYWDMALEQYDEIIYIPLSSGLSGSCNTAIMLAQDEPYDGRVFVVDNGRVATLLHRSILDAVEMIKEGLSAEEIKNKLENAKENMIIYVAVDNLDRLKAGGRINSTTALVGSLLNIKPILQFSTGMLDVFKKCRGISKARKEMILALKEDLNTKFKSWYDRGEVYIVAATSASEEVTESWVAEIKEAFPGMPVLCDDLSLGLSCHIGQNGLGIGCSCKP